MRHAISYLSTAHKDLQEQGVNDIMNETKKFNKSQEMTGNSYIMKEIFSNFSKGKR